MKKVFSLILATLSIFAVGVTTYAYPTQVIDLGDQTIEDVQIGYSGNYRQENLAYWFDTNGITNTDGSTINPVQDQVQHELFYTDIARDYQVQYLGIGYAGYHSPFGVFTYTGDPFETFDSQYITYYAPLFVQNEVAKNSIFDFSIGADTYFGFYLNSNNRGTMLSTLVGSNSDNLDHTLFFETNMGYTISFEDIVGGGDRDYEDLVINFSPTDDSGFTSETPSTAPVPEPSTILFLGTGLLALVGIGRKKFRR